MQIRDYSLPAGWYPRDSASVSSFLSGIEQTRRGCLAAIAPHAGWYYSGRIAARAVLSLQPDAEVIVVLGGHLPSKHPPLFAMEDAVKTPFDPMFIDAKLRSLLIKELKGLEDHYRDNTVEVLLPMVRYFYPEAKLIWMRLGAELKSFESGKIIAQIADKLNRKINILASTDLTHYGSNYSFSPHGRGVEALKWAREVNDAAFIKAVQSGSSEEVLRHAQEDFSSCSAGAVLGAMGFAQAKGLNSAELIEYSTSADVDKSDDIPDSFVGYAAFAFNS
ncbi:MAG: AmmeMemoRadiSam system protein B [Treponema sp.]|nr:AmmeMemoRadiSam system protein B [Treponema sp.]